MKRTIIFLIGLVMLGFLSYFGGYYAYMSANPKTQTIEPVSVQKAVSTEAATENTTQQEYFLIKIEQNMLMVYEMPEGTLYDSVKLSSVQLHGQEQELMEGIVFQTLPEVFEFLENSMS